MALAPPKLGDWGLVGRANDLIRLHEQLVNQGGGAVVPVSGLGGIGKTALALGYLAEYGASYKLIAWIEAERPELIPSQYRALVMNYKGQDLSEEDAVPAVKAIFAETDGWLMVFDNATTPQALAPYLPAGNGRTLVTTRNQSWSPNQAVMVQIDKLPHQEVVGWMAEALPGSQVSDLEGIASHLDGLPLAIVQALAYITARPGETAGTYLTQLKTKQGRYELLKAKQPPNYPQPVATTWDIATDFLAEQVPMALELLRFLAYTDPDALPIPLLDGLMPGQDLPGLLEALNNLGMIRSSSTQVSLHRLVQEVTRWPLGPDQEATFLNAWASHLNNLAPDSQDHHHIPWFRALAPQLLSVGDHLEALGLNPPEFGEVANSCGISLAIGAAHQTALTILERALRIFEAAYGPDHPQVAITLSNLGNVQQELGHHQRAVELYERALRIKEAAYRPDEPEVANTLINLGNVNRGLGHPQRAVELYELALGIFEAAYGPDDPRVAITLASLGNVDLELGHPQQASELYKRALRIFEAAYGPDHPQVAMTVASLGSAHLDLGHPQRAVELYERALRIKEAAYGPDHPQVAMTLTNMGSVQKELGHHQRAVELYDRALRIKEAAYGPDHPGVAITLTNMGSVQKELGHHQRAVELYERALRIFEAAYGPDHPNTLQARQNLAGA